MLTFYPVGNCFDSQTGHYLGPCCDSLICVADKCRDPSKLTGANGANAPVASQLPIPSKLLTAIHNVH